MATCKSCGAAIIWVKTKVGKMMPCNPEMYLYTGGKKDRLVSAEGEIMACEIIDGVDGRVCLGAGYKPHWSTCPNAAGHRGGK